MPNKNDSADVDPRDQRIADLESQVSSLSKQVENLNSENDIIAKNADVKIDALKKKLREAQAASAVPTQGDIVYLGGVAYQVLGTYRADNTFAEVKRGYVNEGSTLVNIAKEH